MIHSMTGFARSEAESGGKTCVVELRSVNHRFLEFNIRIPSKDFELQNRIKGAFGGKVFRGYIEASVTFNNGGENKKRLALDEDMARQFIAAAEVLRGKFGVAGTPDLSAILSLDGIFKYEEEAEDPEARWELIRSALAPALEGLLAMRRKEGESLAADLAEKLDLIEESSKRVLALRKGQEKDIVPKLKAKIAEMAAGTEADPNRIITEAALLAERSDISEETTRMGCHIAQMRELLAAGGAVGRKVEFILQEMNREANTISSKSTAYDISREVVEIKSNLEKMREQAANIE